MNTMRLLVLGIVAVFWQTPSVVAQDASRPNILFIAIDDLNHWMGHLGRNSQTKTPHLDRLAARGVSFANAYCAVPACNPSRAALMSGYRPTSTGCYTNNDFWKEFIPEGISLNATFKKAGYYVAGAGKIYHSDSYYESEWDEYGRIQGSQQSRDVDKYEGFHEELNHDLKDEDLSDYAITDYCIAQLDKSHDRPFFLACGLHKPHLPWAVPKKYYELFPLESIELPHYQDHDLDDLPVAGVKMAGPENDHARFLKSGRWKNAIQSYLATIAYCDMNIGRLLDAFDRSPYRDNTIIVLWGDHGWHLGEKHHWRKFALWEEATRSPLICVAPGVTPQGEICRRTVDFMGIYPTLCELAGLKTPDHVQGVSLVPLLKDPASEWSLPAIMTHGQGNHALRNEDFRLIQYRDGSVELYDERKDPYEWTNLAGEPRYASVIDELKAQLPQVKLLDLLPGGGSANGKRPKNKPNK